MEEEKKLYILEEKKLYFGRRKKTLGLNIV
jgi:hypothetical protein